MNYTKNKKYFRPVKFIGAIILIFIGVQICAVGLGVLLGEDISGLIVALVGLAVSGGGVLWLILKKKKSCVTDAEYDASVLSMINDIQTKAMNKLGVDEDEVKEIAPIMFDGYVFKDGCLTKKGKDKRWRSNKYEACALLFSANEIYCYKYKFNTTEPEQAEETEVYFYKDVVSVSTVSETVKLFGKDVNYESFKLTTTGGNAFSVSVRDIDNAQRSINAMRALLKIKKQV